MNANAAAVTKNPVCKHGSLSTPPLLEACAACHCQCPVIQGQLPQENIECASGCCNNMPASAAYGSPRIPIINTIPLPPPRLSEPELPKGASRSFNRLLSGQRTHALRRPTCRGRAKSKTEPQELCEQRRERKISPCSLRNSGLNLNNQLDVPWICGIPE